MNGALALGRAPRPKAAPSPQLGLPGLPRPARLVSGTLSRPRLAQRLREEAALLCLGIAWVLKLAFPTLLFLAGEPSAGGAVPPQRPLLPCSHHPPPPSPQSEECGSRTLWGLFPIPF